MKQLLPLAAVLALAACHARKPDADWKKALAGVGVASAPAVPDAPRRFELGRMLVIERTDKHSQLSYIQATTVIAADAAKRDAIAHVAQALFPSETGGPTGPHALEIPAVPPLGLSITTADDYVNGMRDSEERRRKRGEPGPFALDFDKIHADLDKDLATHDAVVLRYLHERAD